MYRTSYVTVQVHARGQSPSPRAWVALWAIVGIWLIASQILAAPLVASLVGVATACDTSAYGVYMLRVKRAIMAALDESVHPVSPAS